MLVLGYYYSAGPTTFTLPVSLSPSSVMCSHVSPNNANVHAAAMPDERILLVTGIPSKQCTSEYLYSLFGAYGGIQQIRIGSSFITKGCAIVVYEQCEAANNAVGALNEYALSKDRILRVSVYEEERDKKALERRKRKREMQAEYKKHIANVAQAADEPDR
ncbi:RNA recognition motif. (a.k.a. RRM, RBD, or RNP domain), putative [Leishmania lindenbergi]|uniref:RNA recognition motif (RRM, RBD, or RNP domain) n=1 Tax=Leishmania lindenbergi TaxID=651832 RepID=A0AAW2ZR93_9TRYP